MSDVHTEIEPISTQSIGAVGRSRPFQVTGKLKVAIEAMVWLALPRAQAAEHAGLTEHGLYKALRKPPVRAAYLAELEVLRTSERARNIHTLAEVRDQTDNQMARVQAVKALEQMDEQDVSRGRSTATNHPGLVIVINSGQPGATPEPARTQTIDVKANPRTD